MAKKQVLILINESLFIEFHKHMLDLRSTPTENITNYIKSVVNDEYLDDDINTTYKISVIEDPDKTKKNASFNIDEQLYSEYKKKMIDKRTTPTADITRYIRKVVYDNYVNSN